MRPLLLLLLLSLSFAQRYPEHVKETLRRITDRLYGVFGVYEQVSYENRGFISNAYFYVADDGVLVVDALSTYKLGKELLETIRGITDKPVRFLVITHYHTDHFYGAKALKEAGAEVIAHENAYEYLSDPSSYNFFLARKKILGEHMEGTELTPPSLTLKDSLNVYMREGEGLKRFEVMHLCEGHTPSDVVVFLPEERILISGDLVFDGRLPFLGSGNSRSWLVCLEKIRELRPRMLLPGHGEPMLTKEQALRAIEQTEKYIRELRSAVKKLIQEGCDVECVRERINEVMLSVDPSYAQIPVFFSVNPVNAYYVYFEIENELLMEE
ncbi:MAG: MBL fold metallo-hydrolase [Aquificae bacterium]|nr:MBL fold metallo-hydrolase [Aquificota bacterium]